MNVSRFFKPFPMKRSSLLFIALFLVGGAYGQLVATYFTDTACQTMAPNPTGGVSNPFAVPLNTCVKSLGGFNSRASACASGTFTSQTFRTEDTSCTNAALATVTDRTNACIVLPSSIGGASSYRVQCTGSTSNSLQLSVALFVAVAFVAYF
jgi:hypothetical protein